MRRARVTRLLLACSALALAACANAKSAAECRLNSDCGRGAYCATPGYCRTDCRDDLDCAGGVCESLIGKCTGAVDGGAADLGAGDLAAPAADFATAQDLAMAPDLALRPYGDVCQSPPQDPTCASGYCSTDPFDDAIRECTEPCTSSATCALADLCVGHAQCAQSDIGRSCVLANQGADCRGGACAGGGAAPAICTAECQSAADCPAGWSCSPLSGTYVCTNLSGQTQSCGQNGPPCWYGAACDPQRSLCVGACRDDADCPIGSACSGGGCAVVGRGGLGAACSAGSDCRSGACLGGACTEYCGVTKDRGQFCPAGWGANPVDDGTGQGTMVLVCVAAGAGAVGDPCVDNTSCASGLCLGTKPNAYCSRFCNSAPCPSTAPACVPLGVMVDGVSLRACSK